VIRAGAGSRRCRPGTSRARRRHWGDCAGRTGLQRTGCSHES